MSATHLSLLQRQRSHLLIVLSNPRSGEGPAFLNWYQGFYRSTISRLPGVIAGGQYERHELDITNGQWPRLPYQYLAVYDLSLDGAEQAEDLLSKIAALHTEQPAADAPVTWLYYPSSEKVGRAPSTTPTMLTVAFANGMQGQESEFREWYATRHIRHALRLPALVSGQCYERTHFQRPGAIGAKFEIVAIYEQEGTAEALIESFATLPAGALSFPMLDVDPERFSESIYRPL